MSTQVAISSEPARPVGSSRGRRLAITAALSATVLSLLAVAIVRMLGSGPNYYRQIDGISDEERTVESRQFVQQSSAVFNQIENGPEWSAMFRESQVNAWLAGDFERKHGDLLPRGVSDPRVSFDDGRVALAFQLQRGPVTTIVSALGRIWLPESNFVAFELESVQAGMIPMPAGYVIQAVSSAAKSAGLDLEWKQHEGNPVALLRLSRSDQNSAVCVDHVEIKDGTLCLAGRSQGQGKLRRFGSDDDSSGISWNDQSPDSARRK